MSKYTNDRAINKGSSRYNETFSEEEKEIKKTHQHQKNGEFFLSFADSVIKMTHHSQDKMLLHAPLKNVKDYDDQEYAQ